MEGRRGEGEEEKVGGGRGREGDGMRGGGEGRRGERGEEGEGMGEEGGEDGMGYTFVLLSSYTRYQAESAPAPGDSWDGMGWDGMEGWRGERKREREGGGEYLYSLSAPSRR